jgi:hypothetical protein
VAVAKRPPTGPARHLLDNAAVNVFNPVQHQAPKGGPVDAALGEFSTSRLSQWGEHLLNEPVGY